MPSSVSRARIRCEAGHHWVCQSSSISGSKGLPRHELVETAQLFLDGAADVLAECEDALVGDPVVDVVALLAAAEDADVAEHRQVLGDVLLRRLEHVGELADGRLAIAQLVKEPDPHRLAKHAEAAGDQLDEIDRQGVRKLHLHLLEE